MSTESKRPRGRPRKIAFGSLDVPAPPITIPQPELRLSKAHRITIHSIAREARISPATVLDDVINQGIPQVREMYADLIECRRRLEQRQRENGQEQRNLERPLPKTTDLGTPGNGRTFAQSDSGAGQFDNALELERGYEGETQAAVAALSADDTLLAEAE